MKTPGGIAGRVTLKSSWTRSRPNHAYLDLGRPRLGTNRPGLRRTRLHPQQREAAPANPKCQDHAQPKRGDRRANQNHRVYKILHPGLKVLPNPTSLSVATVDRDTIPRHSTHSYCRRKRANVDPSFYCRIRYPIGLGVSILAGVRCLHPTPAGIARALSPK